MQRLVAIAIAALAVVAIVVYFGRSSEPTAASAGKPEQPPPLIREPGTAPTPPQPPPPPLKQPEAPTAPTPNPAVPLQTFKPPAPVDPKTALRRPAPSLTKEEQQQLAACNAALELKLKRAQAARDAEAKDPAWAYRMEEKLRAHMSRRFRSIPVEVTGIDCKTTFCEVRAQSFTPETAAEFNRAIHALSLYPPIDFQGMSMSHTEEAGKTMHVARLKRKPEGNVQDEEELNEQEEACWELSSLQSKRDKAARDTEPRDSGWADSMEPLLRQHISAALRKHPIAELEITCRTTFCEIVAGGRTSEAQEAFQKVAHEVASEAWADMSVGVSGSAGFGNDRWEAMQILQRKDSG